MLILFRRFKPRFRVRQVVFVQREEAGTGYYMQIQKRRWVRQNGSAHWDWFYSGPTFEVSGMKLSLRSRDESHHEQGLCDSGLEFF